MPPAPSTQREKSREAAAENDIGRPNIMGEIIQVLTSDGTIHIHRDILTSTSDFLKKAVNPEWHTNDGIPIDLSDEMPAIVEVYFQWLYSRTLFIDTLSAGRYTTLARLYVLGEKLLDQKLQEAVMHAMLATIQVVPTLYPGMKAIKIIHDGTPKGSPARRLMVDFWAYSADFTWDGPRNPAYLRGTDFFEELLPCLFALRARPIEEVMRPWVGALDAYQYGVRAERYKVRTGAAESQDTDVDSADERDISTLNMMDL